MKLFGRISIISATFIVILFLSTALAVISLQYYKQNSQLQMFYKDEAIGIESARELMLALIDLSLAENISEDRLNQIKELVLKSHMQIFSVKIYTGDTAKKNYKSSEQEEADRLIKIIKNLNDLRSNESRTFLANTTLAYLRWTLEESNLILDPEFKTYYLIDGLFLKFPRVIYPGIVSNQKSNDLQSQYARIESHFEATELKRTIERLSKAHQLSASSLKKIVDLSQLESIKIKLDYLISYLELQKNTRKSKINSDELVKITQHSKEIVFLGVDFFNYLNNARIETSKKNAEISIAISLSLWIFSLFVTALIIYSVVQTNSLMNKVITDQWSALDKAQKLATLGEISASIGHDIMSPLTVIKSSTKSIERIFGEEKTEIKIHTGRIIRMVDRIESIVRSMKSFLGHSSEIEKKEKIQIRSVVDDLKLLMNKKIVENQIELDLSGLDENLTIEANESELVQVFVNLVNNSVDAMKKSAERKVYITSDCRKDYCTFRFADTGPGVPKEILPKLFIPLFTTKSKDEGTGLGLSISKKIISKYGGNLKYVEGQGGAVFEFSLRSC